MTFKIHFTHTPFLPARSQNDATNLAQRYQCAKIIEKFGAVV